MKLGTGYLNYFQHVPHRKSDECAATPPEVRAQLDAELVGGICCLDFLPENKQNSPQ